MDETRRQVLSSSVFFYYQPQKQLLNSFNVAVRCNVQEGVVVTRRDYLAPLFVNAMTNVLMNSQDMMIFLVLVPTMLMTMIMSLKMMRIIEIVIF